MIYLGSHGDLLGKLELETKSLNFHACTLNMYLAKVFVLISNMFWWPGAEQVQEKFAKIITDLFVCKVCSLF